MFRDTFWVVFDDVKHVFLIICRVNYVFSIFGPYNIFLSVDNNIMKY